MNPEIQHVRDLLADDLDEGFAELVRTHSSRIYSLHLRLTGSAEDAYDLGQETFLRAYTALRTYAPTRRRQLNPTPWLTTIGMNLWRNGLRDRSRRPVTVAQHDDGGDEGVPRDAGTSTAEDRVVALDDLERVAALLATLPETHRLAVVLRHVVGLSYQEMAEVLGCPVGTAKANTSRGLTALRARLGVSDDQLPVSP